MADLQQHDEEQTTVNDLIDNMKTYLGDCDSLPYGFTHMKKMIKDHYGNEIIIAEINGKSNVVTFTTTASKILHDFHQQSERDDSLREKMRIIETAAKLIKNDIKSDIQSTDYYPTSKEMSAETAIDFLPESLRALLQIFIPAEKLPHWGKLSCRPQDQEFFYVLYNLDLACNCTIIFHLDF